MPNAKRPTHTSSPIAVIEIESSPEPEPELEYIAPRRVTRSASRARSVSAQPPPQSQGKGKGREKPASRGTGRKPVPSKAPVHLGAVIELTDSEPEVEPVAGPSRTPARTPARTPSHTRLNFNALQTKPVGASASSDNIPVASGSGSGSGSQSSNSNTNARKRKLGAHAMPLFLPSDEENEPPFTFSDDEDEDGRGAKKLHLHRGKDKGKGKEKEKTNDKNYNINHKGKDKGKGKQKAVEEVIDVDLEMDPHRNLDADLEDDWDPEFSKKPFPFHFVDDDPLRAVLAPEPEPEPEPEVPIQKAAEPRHVEHRPAELRPIEHRPVEHRPAAPAPVPPPAPAPVLEPVDVFLPRRMQPLPGAEPFQWGGPVLRLPQLVEERFENAVVPFPAPARIPAPVAPAAPENHPAPAQLLQPPVQHEPAPAPALLPPQVPQPAPEPEPEIDPASKAVAQVLEIIPDVEPGYLLELIQTHLPNFQAQTAEHVVGVLFEAGDYPRVEKNKNKGKRKSDVGMGGREEGEGEGEGEGGERKKVKVDYASVERPLIGGQDYTELALVQLQTSFPLIPKPYLRQTLQRHRGLYAPTHLFLAAAERTYAAQAQYPGAHPGRPYVLKSTRYNPNKDRKRMKDVVCEAFVEERRWLVEYLQDPGETDAMTAGAGAGVRAEEVEGKGKGKEKAVVEEDGPLEEGTGIECQCCFAEYAFDKMVQCTEAHLFCRDCVSQYASTKLGEHNHLINCMHESGCKEPFPVSELRRILSPKLMDLYERVKQQKEIEAAGLEGLEECPFCEWKCVLEVSSEEEKLFRCGNEEGGCGVVSCRLCKKKEHLPKTCQEAEEDKHLDGRHAIEEAMTRALMRNCPKCNKAFIKEAGCNKMTCPNCRTLSCYVCRKVITGYDHFDQTPAGRPSTSKKSGKCMLWDQVEERHANEVKAAAEKALQEYKLAHPDVEEKDIKVDVPVAPPPPAQAQAQPVNRPMLPGVQVVAGGVHYQIPPAHFQAGRWAGLNVNFNYNNMAPGQGFGFGIAPAAQVQHAVHVVHPYQRQLAQPIFGRLQPQAQAQVVQVPPPLVVPQRPVRVQPAPAAPAPRVAQARQRQQAIRRQVQQARQAAALPVPAPAPALAPALVQQHQQPQFQPVQNYAVQHLGGQARAQADLEEAQRLVAQEGYRQRLRTHQEQFQQIQQMRRQDEEMNARLRQMAQRARAAAAAQAAVAGPARRARR